MPIKPENLKLYPKNWKAIRLEILERAGYRCECRGECGVKHYRDLVSTKTGRCVKNDGQLLAWKFDRKKDEWVKIKVVLTIAHLNHKPRDSRRKNLKAMCQACCFAFDRSLHQQRASANRSRKRGERMLW